MKKKINKQRLIEQLKLGAVALGLALIVWIIAKSGETREVWLKVPVEVTSIGPQIEAQVLPSEVEVLVRYGSDSRAYISSDNFKFVIDASEYQEGLGVSWKKVTIPLSDINWRANTKVDLAKNSLRGSTVDLMLRYNAVGAIVKPDIINMDQVPDGYQLVTPVKVSPREVYLIGDKDKLDSLKVDDLTSKIQVNTAPVSVAGKTASSLEPAEVILPPGISIVDRNSNLVEVTIEIQEVQTIREVTNIPLNFSAIAPDFVHMSYSPRVATVQVKGPQSLLRQLESDSFRINLVRPQEEVPGTKLSLPLEVNFATTIPDDVRARVEIQKIEPASLQVEYSEVKPSGANVPSAPTPTPEQ